MASLNRFFRFSTHVILRVAFGDSFANLKIGLRTALKAVFWQKILRVNADVAWPVHRSSVFKSARKMVRGDRLPGISHNCYFDARNGIELGRNVWIGPNVSIISMNHDQVNFNKYISGNPIKIGANSWIGAGSIILPGVELAENTIVGAGAVVTKTFVKPNTLIAGNPAKEIKDYKG